MSIPPKSLINDTSVMQNSFVLTCEFAYMNKKTKEVFCTCPEETCTYCKGTYCYSNNKCPQKKKFAISREYKKDFTKAWNTEIIYRSHKTMKELFTTDLEWMFKMCSQVYMYNQQYDAFKLLALEIINAYYSNKYKDKKKVQKCIIQ